MSAAPGAPYLVVGGGVTGLAAAFELARAGRDVELVESRRLGGKVRTEVVEGCLVEHGPDSFVSYRPGAMEMARELGLDDDVVGVVPPRDVALRVRGRLEPIPPGMGMVLPTRLAPFASTSILTWPEKVRALLDLVLPRSLDADDVSIGELVRRRLGDGVAERFADPMVGGIYGATVDQLSVDAVLPMLRGYERDHRSLVLASLRQARSTAGPPAGAASPFRSMRRGMGQLVDALVGRLETDAHVRLSVGAAVTALEPAASGVRAVLDDGTEVVAAGAVLAGGARTSGALLRPLAPGAAEALDAIPQASTRSVHLAFDRDAFVDPPVGHGYLEAGPERAPISGVTVASQKWPGRAPEGTVLVRAFVPDRVGPAAALGDDELLDAVEDHVAGVLGATRSAQLRHLVRWHDVMPAYTVGHLGRVAAVDDALAATSIRVAGSALHGVGVPECLADGRRRAAELLAAEADR